MAIVFSSQEIKIEINVGSIAAADFKELKECTGTGKTSDLNVDERDTYGASWTKRTATGGKKMDFSFEVKLTPKDDAHDYLRNLAFSKDINDHNHQQIQLTFPKADVSNSKQRTELYTGIIKITADGGQAATDLAVINFDFMSSGAPEIEKEAA